VLVPLKQGLKHRIIQLAKQGKDIFKC